MTVLEKITLLHNVALRNNAISWNRGKREVLSYNTLSDSPATRVACHAVPAQLGATDLGPHSHEYFNFVKS